MTDVPPSMLPLTLANPVVRRKAKTLLGPLSLEITADDAHSRILVIGPNGAGKTTLLKLLTGLVRPDEGELHWSIDERQAHKALSLVFQTPVMLRRTVLQNAAFPLRVQGKSRKEAAHTATLWLERVGLSQFATQPAQILSGGEKQKLALARAMTTNPQLLLLDEPSANLDNAAKLEMEALLISLSDGGTQIIMASHDLGQVRRLSTSVLLLNHGQLVEFSPAASFPATQTGKRFVEGEIVL